MNNGYVFYFADGKTEDSILTFPITPGELKIKVGTKNKVVTLINEGDINILKSPSLVEVEFEARFPMRWYPYCQTKEVLDFQSYYEKFKDLKENKKSFRFIVARATPNGTRTWDTNLLVAIEDFELTETADEGDDVLVSFKLKQYKEYGVKTLPESYLKKTTSTSETSRPTDNNGTASSYYTVKSGDTLWAIAKQFYGNGAKYTTIYNANKTTIENEAKKRGKSSSSNGHWIYPGTKLFIPGVNDTSYSTSSSSSTTASSSTSSSTSNKTTSDLNKMAFKEERLDEGLKSYKLTILSPYGDRSSDTKIMCEVNDKNPSTTLVANNSGAYLDKVAEGTKVSITGYVSKSDIPSGKSLKCTLFINNNPVKTETVERQLISILLTQVCSCELQIKQDTLITMKCEAV